MKIVARCIICDHEVESTEGLKACPKCGTESLPCDPLEDVTVNINWHELRILSCWAEFWANHNEATAKPNASMRQTVYSIVRRLEVQHPSLPALTLGGELREIEKTHKNITVITDIPHEKLFDPTDQ